MGANTRWVDFEASPDQMVRMWKFVLKRRSEFRCNKGGRFWGRSFWSVEFLGTTQLSGIREARFGQKKMIDILSSRGIWNIEFEICGSEVVESIWPRSVAPLHDQHDSCGPWSVCVDPTHVLQETVFMMEHMCHMFVKFVQSLHYQTLRSKKNKNPRQPAKPRMHRMCLKFAIIAVCIGRPALTYLHKFFIRPHQM